MSHLTKCKTKITNLEILKQAAKNLGVEVTGRNSEYSSIYESEIYDATMVFSYKNGTAAVTKNKKDFYELIIDNYCNPIREKIGEDCSLLGREYTKLTVMQQAIFMGGVVTSTVTKENGEINILIENNGINESWPDWSPDGEKVIYERNSGGNYGIYVINKDRSGHKALLDTESGNEINPHWR